MWIVQLTNKRTNQKSYYFNKIMEEINTTLSKNKACVFYDPILAKTVSNWWLKSANFTTQLIEKTYEQ